MKFSIQNKSFIHFQSNIKHNDNLLIMLFESIQVMCIGKEGILCFLNTLLFLRNFIFF